MSGWNFLAAINGFHRGIGFHHPLIGLLFLAAIFAAVAALVSLIVYLVQK